MLLNLRRPRALAPEKARLGRHADKSQSRIVDVANVASGREMIAHGPKPRTARTTARTLPAIVPMILRISRLRNSRSRVSNAACVAPKERSRKENENAMNSGWTSGCP